MLVRQTLHFPTQMLTAEHNYCRLQHTWNFSCISYTMSCY